MARKLTVKQEAFVKVYLTNGRNATAAYRAAYDATGMSAPAISVESGKLLKHPGIALRVTEVIEKIEAKTLLTVERLDQEIAAIAFADIRGAFKEDGTLKPMSEWPDDVAASINGIETSEIAGLGTIRKIKRVDKAAALMLAARRLGALKDKVEVNHTITLEMIVMAGIKPPDGQKTIDVAPEAQDAA